MLSGVEPTVQQIGMIPPVPGGMRSIEAETVDELPSGKGWFWRRESRTRLANEGQSPELRG